MDIKTFAEKRTALFHIDPRKLKVVEGWNSRSAADADNEEHIAALTRSIVAIGVLNPLTVYADGEDVFISDGHCRLKAILRAIEQGAEIKTVPCALEPRAASEADRVLGQITRNSGKPLTPYEQGQVYKRLVAYGWCIGEIAMRSGKSETVINQALLLHGAAPDVQKLVASGKVSSTLAAKVVREEGKNAGAKLAKAVKVAAKEGKTRATEKHVDPPTPKAGLSRPLFEGDLVAALRKIAAITDCDVASFIAREALIAAGFEA